MGTIKKNFDWDELEFLSQQERIERLKQRAAELSGGDMTTLEKEEAPADVIEQFWRNVVQFEEREQGLGGVGLPPVQFPDPDSLSDEELEKVLWEKIEELAERRFYLEQTDHLSDRELYEHLCDPEIRDLTSQARLPGESFHWDILGSYSEEDIQLYLRYYADDDTREEWKQDWPKEEIPPKQDPPYDRDSRLPRPENW